MDNLQNIQNQIKQKLLSSVVEGVDRFPAPPPYSMIDDSKMEDSRSAILSCRLCPIHKTRKRVVVDSYVPKMYFVLSDFPDKEDEASNEVYSTQSPLSSIAINLLTKLEIQPFCHYSFALKCFPEKELPDNSLLTCANQNLSVEILNVMPGIILCFGYRALQSLIALDSSLKSHLFVENSECSSFCIGNLAIRLFFLSSIRDLRDFPHWRKQVWNVLSPLAKDASSLSL